MKHNIPRVKPYIPWGNPTKQHVTRGKGHQTPCFMGKTP